MATPATGQAAPRRIDLRRLWPWFGLGAVAALLVGLLVAGRLWPAEPQMAKLGAGCAPTRGYLSCAGANLSYSDLRSLDLKYADFRGADLSYAAFYGANLLYADLSRANLRGANVIGADLRGVKLWDADLSGAWTDDRSLWGASFCRTKMSNGQLSNTNC